jgi:glycosyltransferase 2 family protein
VPANQPIAFAPRTTEAQTSVVLRLCVGLLASGLFTGAVLGLAPPSLVLGALRECRPEWLVAAVVAIELSFTVRISRWTLLLRRTGVDVRFRDAAVPMMGSVALNNLLPFRAGDAIRFIALRNFTGAVAPRQIGALALERLIDFHVLVTIVFVTAMFWPPQARGPGLLWLEGAAGATAVALPVTLLLAPRMVRLASRWVERHAPGVLPPEGAALPVYESLRDLCRPGLLARLWIMSLAAWLAEAGAFMATGAALGLTFPLQVGALGVGLATLATGIPSLPGYVGTFDYFAAAAAMAYGAAPAHAVAFAVLTHALLWISGTVAGWCLLMEAERIGVARGRLDAGLRPPRPRGG